MIKSQPIIASLLALPMLASYWAGLLFPWPGLTTVGLCSGALFFGYIILVVLAYVLRSQYVTQEVISGALVVYLLLGLLWTFLFTLVEHLNPGSFSFANTLGAENRFSFLYYSYVTLTTLGYGDITPLTQMSTALAVLEAIVGQIYLTVLIARLVGLHISHNPSSPK
ncbi:MAG: potassium channel family protein [Syntrophotaleaceae bacterium]